MTDEDNSNTALVSADRGFMCTSEHAVEVAQMVSNLECAYENDRNGRSDLLEVFADYLLGNLSPEDVNNILYVEWEECFPGRAKNVD